MKAFLTSKPGVAALLGFALIMAFAFYRVAQRHQGSEVPPPPAKVNAPSKPSVAAPSTAAMASPAAATGALAENAAYLQDYVSLARPREEHDAQGNVVRRRKAAATPSAAGRETVLDSRPDSAARPARSSLRLQGAVTGRGTPGRETPAARSAQVAVATPTSPDARAAARVRPARFNPYGRVIKCELVFTIDSTNEQTPLIGLVMEPVYNNGVLVVPAGAELHGAARPDRLRDRLFSGQDWVLVFPREGGQLNGRQLNVHGVALDRVEPDANGMTWGITDGSFGLQGTVIRTLENEAIKRFVATFVSAGAMALQERQTERGGQQAVRNTPQNAGLQGLAANFQTMADEITAEIERHGVFIRVPAGKQFYFYPMQIIDADAADISSDIATVK